MYLSKNSKVLNDISGDSGDSWKRIASAIGSSRLGRGWVIWVDFETDIFSFDQVNFHLDFASTVWWFALHRAPSIFRPTRLTALCCYTTCNVRHNVILLRAIHFISFHFISFHFSLVHFDSITYLSFIFPTLWPLWNYHKLDCWNEIVK